jgi:integrase
VRAEVLPSPLQLRSILAAIPSHQPQSTVYATFLATMYFGGLRPGEVHALRVQDLEIPRQGWGTIHVRQTRRDSAARWIDNEGERVGSPKARAHNDPGRDVPIPPELVKRLHEHLVSFPSNVSGRVFATRNDQPLSQSNVNRAWARAKRSVLAPRHTLHACRVYDLRAAAGTTWLRAGVPIPVVAQRLGHSPDVLLRIYAGVLPDDAAIANDRIDRVL